MPASQGSGRTGCTLVRHAFPRHVASEGPGVGAVGVRAWGAATGRGEPAGRPSGDTEGEGEPSQESWLCARMRAQLGAQDGWVPVGGVDPSLQAETRIPGPSPATAPAPRQQKPRPSHARDERFRSDVHTEAVQAALAKYKERKMPMPSKRRSVLTHTSVEAHTPPDTSSASEDEGSLRRPGRLASAPLQSHPSVEPWLEQVTQGSSTSSSASSTSSHPGGQPAAAPSAAAAPAGPAALARFNFPKLSSAFDGVPVSSRVSSKIQQLLNTLKKPKRPPLKEFFVDDFEELLEVQQPDPSQPKPEGGQMAVLEGELLAVGSTWPPSLLAALQQWGTTQPKAPCLTALDTTGKAVYTLTYGNTDFPCEGACGDCGRTAGTAAGRRRPHLAVPRIPPSPASRCPPLPAVPRIPPSPASRRPPLPGSPSHASLRLRAS
ncbi:hypothetical protein J1605_003664 [Eschrichtius robustus]|uniref:DMAP1-binding domain-containing protein n=1 Tax=Eschrichtius robustus TaxID=9764 RepID=A0AB34HRH0_ESCRO|nr:hypothetical protein J1605_003664 [Eschrichtius robustus]